MIGEFYPYRNPDKDNCWVGKVVQTGEEELKELVLVQITLNNAHKARIYLTE